MTGNSNQICKHAETLKTEVELLYKLATAMNI